MVLQPDSHPGETPQPYTLADGKQEALFKQMTGNLTPSALIAMITSNSSNVAMLPGGVTAHVIRGTRTLVVRGANQVAQGFEIKNA